MVNGELQGDYSFLCLYFIILIHKALFSKSFWECKN